MREDLGHIWELRRHRSLSSFVTARHQVIASHKLCRVYQIVMHVSSPTGGPHAKVVGYCNNCTTNPRSFVFNLHVFSADFRKLSSGCVKCEERRDAPLHFFAPIFKVLCKFHISTLLLTSFNLLHLLNKTLYISSFFSFLQFSY